MILEKSKMDRINELARISKTRPLDEIERIEQTALRAEYLEKFREGFRAQLEQIEIVEGEIAARTDTGSQSKIN